MKVAINKCFGGFSISDAGLERLTGKPNDEYYREKYGHSEPKWDGRYTMFANMNSLPDEFDRSDPRLISVIEEMGNDFNGRCGKIKIIEIPDGVDYEIDEYDGMESIHEKHRSWE